MACQKSMNQCFDLRRKDDLNKIASNITEPIQLLAKVINAIKVAILITNSCQQFQDLHAKKYIKELERKLAEEQLKNRNLENDNQELKNHNSRLMQQ